MATTVSIGGFNQVGSYRETHGTFTTADKDAAITIITGLNYIFDGAYDVTLAKGALDPQQPKVSVSGGTITGTVDDTQGLSGSYWARGR